MEQTNSPKIPWWHRTTVYQIYPRSFFDSNMDGIGDIKGIIQKLDYLKELGIETIWFSPFYRSPQADFGYDISDYRDIAPEYGNMELCDKLIEEIHKRDMKIVLDMVLNHTSDQHPWFIESRSSRDNPKRDWYIWRDGKKPNGKAPPNNWKSMITGSGWHYDKKTDQWYWAQFLPFQPDLNYRNPEVKEMMFDTIRFWLKKKVDGFRLDIINAIYEDPEFRDNPHSWRLVPNENDPSALFINPKYTINHPDTFQFAKELREVLDEFGAPERFLVGEVTGSLDTLKKYVGDKKSDGLHSVFLFKTLSAPLKAKVFRELIQDFEKYFHYPYIPTWVFSNHDRFRRISRLDNSLEKAKLNTAFQLSVRGVPYIYYGEEIGMEQHYIPVKYTKDAVAVHFNKVPQFIFKLVWKYAHESINRDECRTPMQWTNERNAGFTNPDIEPWLPISFDYEKRNVETMKKDKDSLWYCYQRFLKVRKEYKTLNLGQIELYPEDMFPKEILAYRRFIPELFNDYIQDENDVGELVIILNFSKRNKKFNIPFLIEKLITSTTINSLAYNIEKINQNKELELLPWEGIIIQTRR